MPTYQNASPSPERLDYINKYSEYLKKVARSFLKRIKPQKRRKY